MTEKWKAKEFDAQKFQHPAIAINYVKAWAPKARKGKGGWRRLYSDLKLEGKRDARGVLMTDRFDTYLLDDDGEGLDFSEDVYEYGPYDGKRASRKGVIMIVGYRYADTYDPDFAKDTTAAF